MLAAIETHRSLLEYDYTVVATPGPMKGVPFKSSGGSIGDLVRMKDSNYHLRIGPGHCYLESRKHFDGKPRIIDLRGEDKFIDENSRTLLRSRRVNMI